MWPKILNRGLLLSIVLFLLCLPIIGQVNFFQNDDWVYYKMVRSFIKGDFTLDPISAPTFYFQGSLGAVFSLLISVESLPVLTLIISVLNFYLIYRVLRDSTKLSDSWSILIALLWFFNPLNIYSSIGFMTENYLMFCILGSLYFFSRFTTTSKIVYFILANSFLFLGLMTKQSALALAISYPAYMLVNRKWKVLTVQLIITVALILIYFLIFPKTPEMYEKPLQFHHLTDWDYLNQVVKAILIYVSAFCFPLILLLIKDRGKLANRRTIITALLVIAIPLMLYFLVFKDFKPTRLGWQEFFYLDNTLERKGFYPRGIMGTKYYFIGMFDLYSYWDLVSKAFAGFVIAGLVWSVRKYKQLAHILAFFFVYLVLMILAEKVYDRYLPPLFLAFILILAAQFDPTGLSKKVKYVITSVLVGFLMFLGFYSYQFSMDFIRVNNYIWSRSLQLVEQEHTLPKYIKGTNAWKLSDYNVERNYLYDFTFDDVTVNQNYGDNYDLVEKKRIVYPGSIFIDPYVYLYKKKNFNEL